MSATPYRSTTLNAPAPLELLAARQLLAWGTIMLALASIAQIVMPLSITALGAATIRTLLIGGATVSAIAAMRFQRSSDGWGRVLAVLSVPVFALTALGHGITWIYPAIPEIMDNPMWAWFCANFSDAYAPGTLATLLALIVFAAPHSSLLKTHKALYVTSSIATLATIALELFSLTSSDPEVRINASFVRQFSAAVSFMIAGFVAIPVAKNPPNSAEFEGIAQSANGLAVRANALKQLSRSSIGMIVTLAGSILLALQLEQVDAWRDVSMKVRGIGMILSALSLLVGFLAIKRLHRWSSHIAGVTPSFVLLLIAVVGAAGTLLRWKTAAAAHFSLQARLQAFGQQGITEMLVLFTLMGLLWATSQTAPEIPKKLVRMVFALTCVLGVQLVAVHIKCADYIMRTTFEHVLVYCTLFTALASVIALAGLLWRGASSLVTKPQIMHPQTH